MVYTFGFDTLDKYIMKCQGLKVQNMKKPKVGIYERHFRALNLRFLKNFEPHPVTLDFLWKIDRYLKQER